MDNIDKLHESSLTAAKTARNRGVVLIIIFIVGGIMTIVINSVLLNKIVAKQVASLAEGIRIIGGGNLDYRIDATGNDELSGLARASNEMVAKLKQSYISMEKLQQEITGRKETEEELRESEEHYRTLFNESLDGLCLADAETGIIIDCNKALAALVCRERAELIGQPQTILHPPRDDKEAFSLTFKKHLTDKEGQILETQVVTRTGDIREVEIKANFVVLQDRKMLQGLFHDITERKLAESQRKAALEEIKSLSEELEQRVIDRTAELTAKTAEMERINKVFVDRELRMRELKARIAELEKKT